MTDENTGKKQEAAQQGSGGVDPTRPIGPGNPPAATMFTSENPGNLDGRPKGSRNAKSIMRDILAFKRGVKPDEGKLRDAVAEYLGKAPEEVTVREMGLVGQARRMVEHEDTSAATFCLKVAGELADDVNINPPTSVHLDDVTKEEVAAALAEIEREKSGGA